jgi:hypothetical protein
MSENMPSQKRPAPPFSLLPSALPVASGKSADIRPAKAVQTASAKLPYTTFKMIIVSISGSPGIP